MSDMSSLSHEYASATDFARQVNEAALVVKKRYLKGTNAADDQHLTQSKSLLHEIVGTLLRRFGHEAGQGGFAEGVPEDVFVRLESRHEGNLGYFKDDLADLSNALGSSAVLSLPQLELLESICEAADASASATFRKLWRR